MRFFMSFFMSMTRKSSVQGFSLVELMIVVAIIGVLASLAVPKFQIFQAKAKQSEAKNNLSHIYTLEQTYFGDNDTFVAFTAVAGVTNLLGFSTQGGNATGAARYAYSGTGNTSTFLATAAALTANNIAAGCLAGLDTWTINQTKTLLNPINCAK